MKEKYNRLFEKAAPGMSDDELFKAVLNSGKERNTEKNNNTSPKRKKAPMIAVIAAAAAVATTAGAVAFYNRSITEDYNNAFAQNAAILSKFSLGAEYKDKDGNVIDPQDKAAEDNIYEKLNIELDKTFKCDRFTLDVPGAISDGKRLYIMYNLIFDEDPWSGKTPWFKENDSIHLIGTTDCAGVKRSGQLALGTRSERDGKTVYSSYFPLIGIENCTKGTVKVSLTSLYGSSMMSGKHYFYAEIEIPLPDDLTKFNKNVDTSGAPNEKFGEWGTWTLTQFEVTPLMLTYTMKTDDERPDELRDYRAKIPVCIRFKDDTVLELTDTYIFDEMFSSKVGGDRKTLRSCITLNYPIDVSEIRSIQFASALADMNGNVTTVDAPEIYVYSTADN